MAAASVGVSEESNYAIATGETDRERLIILNEVYNPFSSRFFEDCGVQKGSRVLELGCGIGLMSQVFAAAVGKEGFVLATDYSDEQLQVARSLLPKEGVSNLEFRMLSAFDIDELDEKFDPVCARFLLVHLKDPQKLIPKIKKILKPGGKLIIEDITSNQTLHSFPHSEGMAALHHIDQLQEEIQQSDANYFTSLPVQLEKEGFKLFSLQRVQPKLSTPRERQMLAYVSSIREAFLNAGKMTEEEWNRTYQKVLELKKDASVDIFYYELGQICAILDF